MENKIFVMNTNILLLNLFALVWQPFNSKLISLTTVYAVIMNGGFFLIKPGVLLFNVCAVAFKINKY